MKAGLPMARWVVQRASRASAWGSSLGLQDPAGLVTCSPLSEPVIPFVLNCCSAIRWLDRSAVQRHRSSTVRWLGCSLCVLPAACCHLPAILRSLPSACWPLPRRARHPNPQHRANEILNQRIRFHGRPTCCIDREELKSPIHEFKHLAPKRCPVPFYDCSNCQRPAYVYFCGSEKPAHEWYVTVLESFLTIFKGRAIRKLKKNNNFPLPKGSQRL